MSDYPTGSASGNTPPDMTPKDNPPMPKQTPTGETASGGMRVVDERRGRNRHGHGDHSSHGGNPYQ